MNAPAAPPKPSFLPERQDAPRLLTPLRRRIRTVYVRMTERGWFGLLPLKTHVVICGFPRSGTTLLQLMLETSAADAKAFGRERSGLSVARYTWPGRHAVLISKKPDDIFHVDEIRSCYSDRQADARFVVSVRDPRSVLTSKFATKPGHFVPAQKWRAVYEHIQYVRQFQDVILVEYRDLVENPNRVQEQLAAFIGCASRTRFDQFLGAVPEHFDTRALNGVRPLDPASIDRWRRPEHRDRIRAILQEIPELPQRLIEMGYESDTAWTQEYL